MFVQERLPICLARRSHYCHLPLSVVLTTNSQSLERCVFYCYYRDRVEMGYCTNVFMDAYAQFVGILFLSVRRFINVLGRPIVCHSHLCTSPVVYQSHCVPVPLCTSRIVYQSLCVPVPWCTSPFVYQPLCVPSRLRISPVVSKSHCVPVPLFASPIVCQSHCVPVPLCPSPIVS